MQTTPPDQEPIRHKIWPPPQPAKQELALPPVQGRQKSKGTKGTPLVHTLLDTLQEGSCPPGWIANMCSRRMEVDTLVFTTSRWLGDHIVAQKSVLAPGMVSASLTSKCRNASCWKVLFRLAGIQDQTPSHREGRRIHKVRDTCPSTLDNWAATPSLSKTTRLPSQDTTVTNHFFVSTATAVAHFDNPTTEQAEPKWLLCYYTPTEASIFGEGNIGFPQHSKSPRQRWEPGLAEALTPLRQTTRTITRPSPGMAEEASPEGARRSKL